MSYVKLAEMEYGERKPIEVLALGDYHGIGYMVTSHGAYPCAYVKVDVSDEEADTLDADSFVDIECHGGVTYFGKLSEVSPVSAENDSYAIGWDYAHYGDYFGDPSLAYNTGDIMWDVDSIAMECESVIDKWGC